jgi:deoxyribodipyrimidine photo-lyase
MVMSPFSFEPTRAAGLARLEHFAPQTGTNYTATRNTDEGPGQRKNVSILSPYLRFRMITEEEVLSTTLDYFNFTTAEKFIQEVLWRAYFKGYLETRPQIWTNYLHELEMLNRNNKDYEDAINGTTGIDCFDHWVHELKTIGYLHNHARMWFASIWMFTLKLPWQLGADFMYRHLIDGDPSSNTLSWRWVGGLHTKGKTYLARPDNIAKYTNNRFQPQGLATVASPLQEIPALEKPLMPTAMGQWPEGDYGLLVTSEDLLSLPTSNPVSIAVSTQPVSKPGGAESDLAKGFRCAALTDAAERLGSDVVRIPTLSSEAVLKWCQTERLRTVAVAYAPVGPEADALFAIEQHLARHDITLLRVRRLYDSLTWPHATKGFFVLKEKLPMLVEKLNVQGAQARLL